MSKKEIDEAIETNKEIHKDGTVTYEKFHKAIQLGIEALERLQEVRGVLDTNLVKAPLPSEAEE